jgi:NSS family neurotransmitter:Na+ symporter
VNNIVIILSVFLECVIFAWIFGAERLVGFLNEKSKTLKVGGWWLVLVKYIIPVLLIVIWVGGLLELLSSGSWEFFMVLIVLAVILLVFSLVFTVLPAKSKKWFEAEERIED